MIRLICIGILFATPAWALPDASIAARASVGAAQELLVSPPLPSLESGGGITFAPQIGHTTVSTKDSKYFEATGFSPAYTQDHKGKISGLTGALSVTGSPHRFSWFGFVVGSKLQGSVDATSNGSPSFSLTDIDATSLGGVAGLSFRFYGESKAPFAMGVFLGPALMNSNSKFTIVQRDIVAPDQDISVNIGSSAAYSGLQAKIRLGKFLINPYILYMKELSPKCKKVDFGGGATCLEIDTSFSGYGLYVGYGAIRVHVFSAVNPSPTMDDLTFTSYSVSYTFGLSGK